MRYFNFWHRFSVYEKLLFSFFWILVVSLPVLFCIYFFEARDKNACRTDECITAALRARASIDSSIEPCDNFYQFACGNFIKYTFISGKYSQKDDFQKVQLHVDGQLKTIIEDEMDVKESRVFELVHKLYRSCMNTIEFGLEKFKTVARKIGGWPMIEGEKWDKTASDWIEMIHRMREIGLPTNYLFDTKIVPNPMNPSVRILAISQPTLDLHHDVFLDDIYASFKLELMVELAINMFGGDRKTVRQECKDVVEFMRALGEISESPKKLQLIKVSELENEYPHLRWMDCFDALMPDDVKITPDEEVIVSTPAYFGRLGEILDKTSKRTIANYFVWRSMRVLEEYVDRELLPIKFKSYDLNESNRRWQTGSCVLFTNFKLPQAIGALYVRKFPNEKSVKSAKHLVEHIRSSFIDMINNVQWMDESTKKAAVDKAKAIVAHIGYPTELTDIKKLEDHYESLTLDENELLMNFLRLQKFRKDYEFRQLRKPVNRTDWFEQAFPAIINAFYMPSENSIQIPAAILQEPFFSVSGPDYLDYGAIGHIIGHEITHGFDNIGRVFDKNGNIKDWWKPRAEAMFSDKCKCFIEEYGNFTVPTLELNIDGEMTLGENIADNSGLKSAYYAYEKWIERNGAEPNLPGLKQYSPKQMFWISAAQVWCAVIGDDLAEYSIDHDEHSPPRFRVIGSLRNSREFAADFECAPGSKMNPIQQCEIW